MIYNLITERERERDSPRALSHQPRSRNHLVQYYFFDATPTCRNTTISRALFGESILWRRYERDRSNGNPLTDAVSPRFNGRPDRL